MPSSLKDTDMYNADILGNYPKAKEALSVFHLIKHYAMKPSKRGDIQAHIFLTSVLVGGEFSA
jgi:hypothetical protein